MKKLILATALAFSITSCKKENPLKPTPEELFERIERENKNPDSAPKVDTASNDIRLG